MIIGCFYLFYHCRYYFSVVFFYLVLFFIKWLYNELLNFLFSKCISSHPTSMCSKLVLLPGSLLFTLNFLNKFLLIEIPHLPFLVIVDFPLNRVYMCLIYIYIYIYIYIFILQYFNTLSHINPSEGAYEIRDVFRTSKMKRFTINYFRKTIYHRCSTWFWLRLWKWHLFTKFSSWNFSTAAPR